METQVNRPKDSSDALDRAGSVASTLCAIHCAICGLLPVAFTALGLGFLLGHKVEWALSITAILLGLGAMVLGWRQHRSWRIAGLLFLGVIGLMVSRGLEMGSGHEDHHEASEHAADHHEGAAVASMEHSDHEEHGAVHEEGHHGSHLAGTLVGVGAGILLLLGHLLNIRESRRCREECC